MAWCARNNMTSLRRSLAGWMPARIGRLSAGVGRMHPVTIRKASLMAGSVRRVWALRHQTGAQYSAVECTRARVAVRNVVAPTPQPEPASRLKSATRDVSFLWSDTRCRRYVSDPSNVTPRQGRNQRKISGGQSHFWQRLWRHRCALNHDATFLLWSAYQHCWRNLFHSGHGRPQGGQNGHLLPLLIGMRTKHV